MRGLTILAVVFICYALIASKLDRWWITAPMVFVAAGALLGPAGVEIPSGRVGPGGRAHHH